MASGNTLAIFTPHQYEPPSSNAATPHARNQHPVLDFDDTTDEAAVFSDVLPQHYGGGGITAYIHYSAAATSGKVRWDISFERIGDGQQDVDSDGFASAQSVNVAAVPATSGMVDIVSIVFTDGAQIDSIAVGELYRIKVERKPSDGTNDTAVGDVELHAVELRET